MRSPVASNRRKQWTINMMSMIDVIFLLLIFFICTANFSPSEERLPMNLSQPGSMEEIVQKTPDEEDFKFVVIRIFHQQGVVHWQLEGRLCRSLGEVDAILAQLASIKPDLPVLIDMDDDVAWEHFIHLYDVCRCRNLSRMQLVGQ